MRTAPRSTSRRRLAVAALLACSALVGCEGSPTAPVADTSQLPPAGQQGRGPWIQSTAASRGGARVQSKDGAGPKTFSLKADQGGTFNYGRYTLNFPPNAVLQDADITITPDPNPSLVGCSLSISPAYLN